MRRLFPKINSQEGLDVMRRRNPYLYRFRLLEGNGSYSDWRLQYGTGTYDVAAYVVRVVLPDTNLGKAYKIYVKRACVDGMMQEHAQEKVYLWQSVMEAVDDA